MDCCIPLTQGQFAIVLGLEHGNRMQADHKNHQTLDNRRTNLRVATPAQNMANIGKTKRNKSGFKGISFDRKYKYWIAQISIKGRNKYLGHFPEPKSAYAAYCQASREYHGEFGRIS